MTSSKSTSVKVGDTVTLAGPAHFVRLPDSTVVTTRASYRFEHAGEHVIFAGDGIGEGVVYDVASDKPEPEPEVEQVAMVPAPAPPIVPAFPPAS